MDSRRGFGGVTDKLLLLDTPSLYFRAFYGVPDTLTAPDGTPVNAVRGLLDTIVRLVRARNPGQLVCRTGSRIDGENPRAAGVEHGERTAGSDGDAREAVNVAGGLPIDRDVAPQRAVGVEHEHV